MTQITLNTLKKLSIGGQINCDTLRGFRARKLESGQVKLGYRYRIGGVQHEAPIGTWPAMTVGDAQTAVHQFAAKVGNGINPLAEIKVERIRAANTVASVIEKWIGERKNELKSIGAVESMFRRHVIPAIGDVVMGDLKRSRIAAMLDEVKASSGPAAAARTASWLNTVCEWYAGRDDDFNNPMPRGFSHDSERDRTLTDEEVRDVWLACDDLGGPFAAIVKMLLLTGCRRMEIGALQSNEFRRDDLHGDYIEIGADRMKSGVAHFVPVTEAMKAVLPAGKSGFLFTCFDRAAPFNAWGKCKARLDAIISMNRCKDGRLPMPAWTLHDTRRTVKSGLARLGVDRLVSEFVLAHSLGGVEGRYDTYGRRDERRDALTRWAAHIDRVVHGSAGANVTQFPATARAAG